MSVWWYSEMVVLLVLVVPLLFWLFVWLIDRYRAHYQSSLYWVWDNGGDGVETPRFKINTDHLVFPNNFLWGVATSGHQSEGECRSCQWVDWENSVDLHGKSRIKDACKSPSKENGHYQYLSEDISLLTTLGVNSYRFSIEWSKIQPQPGVFDQHAIAYYHRVLDGLLNAGIEPMITLIHFTHPRWFEQMGSFEHEANLDFVVTYAQRMFQEYGKKCKKWCTINEPFFFAYGGWMSGNMPPGKQDPQLVGVVLRNLLEAHVRIYHAIKSVYSSSSSAPPPNSTTISTAALTNTTTTTTDTALTTASSSTSTTTTTTTSSSSSSSYSRCQIGLAIAIYHFDAYQPLSLGDVSAASALHAMFNECTVQFLQTGRFTFRHAASSHTTKHDNPLAPKSYDFIGLNYYSHSFVQFQLSLSKPVEIVVPPTALMSDGVNASFYPEGLYRAIRLISSSLGASLPIIITENGCADALDDRRHLFIRRHLYAVSKAIADGYNVVGYYYWSLFDNFEWHEGYTQKYGLFEVCNITPAYNNQTSSGTSSSGSSTSSNDVRKRERIVRLRDGAKAYMRVIYRFTGRGQYPMFAYNNIVQGARYFVGANSSASAGAAGRWMMSSGNKGADTRNVDKFYGDGATNSGRGGGSSNTSSTNTSSSSSSSRLRIDASSSSSSTSSSSSSSNGGGSGRSTPMRKSSSMSRMETGGVTSVEEAVAVALERASHAVGRRSGKDEKDSYWPPSASSSSSSSSNEQKKNR